MYQIYSMNRTGNPRWALAAAALLLLIAVALAALLIQHKRRSQIVALETSIQHYPAGGLSIRLPKDWKHIETDLDPGYVVGVRSIDSNEALLVFRGIPKSLGVPSIEGREALRQGLGTEFEEVESSPGQIGPLPGWTCLYTLSSRSNEHQSVYYLGRSAVAPDGQILGIMLAIPRKPRQADRQLLDDLSNHLTLLDHAVADEPQKIMTETGITFDPPDDAQLFVPSDEPSITPSLLRMTGGAGLSRWYLDAARVPLIGDRAVSQLVEDYTLSTLQKISLDEPIQTSTIGNRTMAQTSWALASENGPGVSLFCAQIDEDTALMLIGRHEADGKKKLHRIAESIVADASVKPYKTILDVAEAQTVARDWLRELSSETLSTKWNQLLNRTETYALRAPTLPLFGEVCTYQRSRHGDGLACWEIEVTKVPLSPMSTAQYNIQEKWSISDSGMGHQQWYQQKIQGQPLVVYTEDRSVGENQVVCKLQLGDAPPGQRQMDIDATYGCEPILLQAGAKVALDPQAKPAIFTATEMFIPQPTYWIMTPLGEQQLPNPQSKQLARAVRLVQDYNPSPIILYYDEAETLLAIAFDHRYWKERTGPQQ